MSETYKNQRYLHKYTSIFDVKEYLKKSIHPIVIIPLGSLEIHEYISMGFDTILAERVSERIADELNLLIGPILPIGYSAEHVGEGVIWLKPETYLRVLYDVIDSYLESNFSGFLLLNCHVGNRGLAIATVTQYRRWYSKLKIGHIEVWDYLGKCFDAKTFDDYCIIENSLAIYFGLIDKEQILKEKKEVTGKVKISKLSPWLTTEIEGILIKTLPEASYETGEKIFNCAVDEIIKDIKSWLEESP
ncbi:MAG: creatininase family protein [Candidatus Asgardarchaeia archaeon]